MPSYDLQHSGEKPTERDKPKSLQDSNSTELQQRQVNEANDNPDDVICDWVCVQPHVCQPLAIPACLLLWLCLCSYAQGMLLNGFLNSVLTSIERRFELQSVQTGMIASAYDTGACIAIIPLTFFGRKYRRSRFISIGVLLVACGSFIFTLPHFLAGSYKYATPVKPLCYSNMNFTYPDFCLSQPQSHYRWLFWLAQLLHGVGASPFFTLAIAYLDDNLTIKQSGTFLGIYYVIGLLGPASGYLLGGMVLNIYVDVGVEPEGLSPENTNLWVGAWWIGFLISGSLSLAAVVPLFGFPKSFRGSAKARSERSDESHGDSATRSSRLRARLGDLLPAVHLLLSIPTFVCLTLAGSAASLLITALATFGPKLMQQFFHLAASAATMSIGLVSVPCGALGLLAGAMTIRCLQLPLRRLLLMNAAAAAVALALVAAFFVRCQPHVFAGVDVQYSSSNSSSSSSSSNQLPNLTAACNVNCNCQVDRIMFSPICDFNNIQYFSPCHAGCHANASVLEFKNRRYYTDCACTQKSITVNGLQVQAIEGSCLDSDCTKAPLFLTLLGFFMFFAFFVTVPTLQATIRVIPSDLKDFGIGIQIVMMRLFGSIPAPLLLGRLIDATCSLWGNSCGSTGACIAYNADRLWLLVLLFIACIVLIELLMFISAAALYRPPPAKRATDSQKSVNIYVTQFSLRNKLSDIHDAAAAAAANN